MPQLRLLLVGLTMSHIVTVGVAETTVIVMRHCVRSTPEDGISDVDGLPYFNNYSQASWAAFDVPAYFCMPRGAELIASAGKWLAKYGSLPQPVQVIADDCERDWQTASSLLQGYENTSIGKAQQPFVIDSRPFKARVSADCPKLSPTDARAAILQQMASIHPPEELDKMLAEMGEAMGEGAAGSWWQTGCQLANESSELSGACAAGSDFVERFLFQWGSGLPVAWGKLSASSIPRLLAAHSWFRDVTSAAPPIVRREQAPILRTVLSLLEASAAGTTIFVGHDTQLNALSGGIGLTWDPSPFPLNATLPGSFLRFTRSGDDVEVTYSYHANFSSVEAPMRTVPASFVEGGVVAGGLTTFDNFKQKVEAGSDAHCAPDHLSKQVQHDITV